jgi:hypothetical protein
MTHKKHAFITALKRVCWGSGNSSLGERNENQQAKLEIGLQSPLSPTQQFRYKLQKKKGMVVVLFYFRFLSSRAAAAATMTMTAAPMAM